MLRVWINGMRHSGVENFMVICLDDEVREMCIQYHSRGMHSIMCTRYFKGVDVMH